MIELLTTDEMAAADRLAIAGGISGMALMEAAGRAVADHAATMAGKAGTIAVVCGPGNNGGDGFVAARLLLERGHAVRVVLLGRREDLKADAAEAARRWPGEVAAAEPAAFMGAALIVDALFGAGLARPISGQARAMVDAINAAGAPVLAVDLPSGIAGTTAAVMGVAVQAAQTMTFFRRKPAHLLLPGRLHCGPVTVADIGIPRTVLETIRPRTFANIPALWQAAFPVPRIDGHKYTRGHAVVLSGGLASTGAARLAAHAALRAGAGLVTVASPPDALAVNAAANLAVMVRPVDGPAALAELLSDKRINATVLGPGGGVGPTMQGLVTTALAGARTAVLDADALMSFADDLAALVGALQNRSAATIMTPHEGEFARLFKSKPDVIEAKSKLAGARAAARLSGAVVVLKGPDTVVAAPDGRAAIADNAPAWLATAGAGDVLAGMIAGLAAQGMPAFEAASAAVWLHGEAAAAFGPGLISEDLADTLPSVYRRLLDMIAAPPNPRSGWMLDC
jgi:hydroxyethylthiazole kinase-like uncharacterized protein yjeF